MSISVFRAFRRAILSLFLAVTMAHAIPAAAQDCNNNGVPDAQDIDPADPDGNGEVSTDCDANAVPDECDIANCVGDDPVCSDCDGNGALDICQDDLFVSPPGEPHFPGPNPTHHARSVAIDNGYMAVYWRAAIAGPLDFVRVYQYIAEQWTPMEDIQYNDVASVLDGSRLLDMDNGRLVVRSPQSTVEIYQIANGNLTLTDEIEPPAGPYEFALSVAISGDRIVLGLPGNTPSIPGIANVYRHESGAWSPEQTLSHTGGSNLFGAAVDIDGDVLVVGDQTHNGFQGRASIFEFDGAQWSIADSFEGMFNSGIFGYAVSVSGDKVAVGAPSLGIITGSAFGNVYVYERQVSPLGWERIGLFQPAPSTAGPLPGLGVMLFGNRLLYGAPHVNAMHSSLRQSGAIIQEYDGENWTYIGTARSPETPISDYFGSAVAIDGGHVAVCDYRTQVAFSSVNTFVFHSDCDGNGVNDNCDVSNGRADLNANLIPDDCETLCDPDNASIDGFVAALLNTTQNVEALCLYDADQNGQLNGNDLQGVVEALLD